jgi:glutamate synthase domain-containing protein 3
MAKTTRQSSNGTVLEAKGVYYRELNERIRAQIVKGAKNITLEGVNGQRYIGGGLTDGTTITINGVPGNDLGAFMNGPTIVVNDNAQDGVGNTMNSGKIVIKGHAGDVVGYAMRGGKVFVSGDVGYRVGIHMKSFKEQVPVIVAGGHAGDFFGEYMAGGILVLIGLGDPDRPVAGDYLGTGMHGGVIFVRGEIDEGQMGREVRVFEVTDEEKGTLSALLEEFGKDTGEDMSGVKVEDFIALKPFSHRPYGNLYVY